MNFTHLVNELSKYHDDKIIFVGLGNKARGDDAAGLLFTNLLKTKPQFKNSKFIIAAKNPENYLGDIINSKPEVVTFIDAANWGGQPGEISILKSNTITNTDFSTHAYSVKLIEKFLLLNAKMDFCYIGIQTKYTDLGKELSREVENAIKEFLNENEKIEKK